MVVAFEVRYRDRFYPGISIGGQSVGGRTYQEVLASFKADADTLEHDGVSAKFESSRGVQQVNIPSSATGTTPDNSVEYFTLDGWESAVHAAYAWGREANLFHNAAEQATLLLTTKNFTFPVAIQKEAVDSFLEDDIYNFLKKSVPATFSFANGTATVTKEVVGETTDRTAVVDALETKLLHLDTTPATFLIRQDTPQVTAEALEPFLDFADMVAKNITVVFRYNGRQWSVKGPTFATWLSVDRSGALTIDSAALERYLDKTIAPLIDNPPVNSRFAMQNGKLVEIVPGTSGNVVDTDAVIATIENIIAHLPGPTTGTTITVPITTINVEPRVTQKTVEKYRILDLVGTIRTNFDGSTADREHNIRIGAAAINGMLIAPGEEFSTVAAIGPVTAAEGYVKEMVIKENKTTKEFGGGLCQIATTLFRLALNAGLPITERVNHRFVVHYYDPPGLDATIYGPHPDFRFVNDTNNYLLLQARVENKQVIMELYGQKDGRSAHVSKAVAYNKIPAPPTKYVASATLPRGQTTCSEAPHDGVTTDVIYTVTYPDGTVKEKKFHSVYQPWQKVCLVGTS